MATETVPTLTEIREARERLHGIARETPVFGSETFSRMVGRDVQLKAEAIQRTGAFKIRGAFNKLSTLGEAERAAGVVAASAGNHGQAVAWAAREAEIPATIYMPLDAPMAKVEATVNYGAKVELTGYEKIGGGYVTAVVRGEVAAVRAAVQAGELAAQQIGEIVTVHVIPRPAEMVDIALPLGRNPKKK